MKLKVPDKFVHILGTRYPIKRVNGLTANRGNLAESSQYRGEISVDPDMPEALQFEAFVHECVETWDTKMEWNLPHPVITQLETCINQLLVDNIKGMIE